MVEMERLTGDEITCYEYAGQKIVPGVLSPT